MNYLMTGIEIHPDFGFGITAESYYKSAEYLMTNHYEHYDITQQAEMPQNFLFRHSIELYLKSLIIIFHKKLEINYGEESFKNNNPKIEIEKGNWRSLYTCHFIDALYHYWLNNLLLSNVEKLNEIAPKGDWVETKKITELFSIVCKYDKDSSYFRYPITKNSSLDTDKFTMQKFQADNLKKFMEDIKNPDNKENAGGTIMLLIDDQENIKEAFTNKENLLTDVRDALKEIAYYFHCIHIMSRVTLCNGM